jgi:hypothetical protein
MTRICFEMLGTALRVQTAMATACIEVAYRLASRATEEAGGVAESVLDVAKAPALRRQRAAEDAVWSAYASHEEMVRAAAGASSLSLLLFLNELDRRRGPRTPPGAGPRA